jgi:ribonuclease-3
MDALGVFLNLTKLNQEQKDLIMKDLLSALGYSFNEPDLIKLALTHKSLSKDNNERLEFLGDAILNLYVSEKLYTSFKEIDEGKLTRFKASIVSRENLNSVAENLDIAQYIHLGKGEKVTGNSILGNTFEAIVGAIFLDSNYSKTKEILNVLFVKDFQKLQEDTEFKDPKSTLQELTQKKYRSLPLYKLSDSTHHKEINYFEVLCSIDKTNFEVQGKGNTRKGAELDAAQNMLELIQKDV